MSRRMLLLLGGGHSKPACSGVYPERSGCSTVWLTLNDCTADLFEASASYLEIYFNDTIKLQFLVLDFLSPS